MAINELSAKQLSDLRDHPDLARLPDSGSGDDGTRVGLPTATALVTGSIIGTGIFTVPAALAGFGTIGLLAFVIVAIGAMALAALFATLASKRPAAGGPYAYARDAFGDFGGFTTAWSYWLTSWAGNAAIVTGWVLYVAAFFSGWLGWSLTSGTDLFLLALLGLWIPAVINLSGVRQMGWFQVATTVVKFLPLAFLAVFGLFFIETANFGPFNVSGTNWFDAISAAGVVVLFSFLGVETASVAAGKVRNPGRNVPRATLIGTAASAVVYILCTVAIFGVVGTSALTQSGAPFADAFSSILGSTRRRYRRRVAGRDLRFRLLGRLDPHLRRDALRGSQGRAVPQGIRQDHPRQRALVRYHRVHRARHGLHLDQLRDAVLRRLPGQRGDRVGRVPDAGVPDRSHRGHPVLLLGLGADLLAVHRR